MKCPECGYTDDRLAGLRRLQFAKLKETWRSARLLAEGLGADVRLARLRELQSAKLEKAREAARLLVEALGTDDPDQALYAVLDVLSTMAEREGFEQAINAWQNDEDKTSSSSSSWHIISGQPAVTHSFCESSAARSSARISA
jgi:hypothetical protein